MRVQEIIEELKRLEKEEAVKRLMAHSMLSGLDEIAIGNIIGELGLEFRPYGHFMSSTLALIRAAVFQQKELYRILAARAFGVIGAASGYTPVSTIQVAQYFIEDYCIQTQNWLKANQMWREDL